MSKTERRVRLVCMFLAVAAVCAFAQKRISVPKDFPTIQAALTEASEGDTVYVRNGVYYENIIMVDDVVLMGQDKKSTVIDGRRKGPAVTGADGAVLTGFTIRNGRTGVLCKNTRPIITNNVVIDNKGTGIHALVTLPEIVNNVVYRNEWTGIFLESVRGTRTSISHNVIMENGYSGIFCANRTEVLIRNNIIYGNKQYGVFGGPEARKSRLVGNNLYANRLPFNDNLDNQTTQQQNISADPQFVGAGFPRHNYGVKSGSPCKGKGEEGADIGLTESVAAVTLAPDKPKASSELDQYFGSSSSSSASSPSPTSSYSSTPDYGSSSDSYSSGSSSSYGSSSGSSYGGSSGSYSSGSSSSSGSSYGSSSDSYSSGSSSSYGSSGSSYASASSAPMPINAPMLLQGVSFSYGGDQLTPESYQVLDVVYQSLAYYTNLRVEIAGHTDDQGDPDANKSLSMRRARSVVSYFVSKGIPRERVTARGYGMERPVASNFTEEGRAANNRMEVVPLR